LGKKSLKTYGQILYQLRDFNACVHCVAYKGNSLLVHAAQDLNLAKLQHV